MAFMCPFCSHPKSRVTNTYDKRETIGGNEVDVTRRRRVCLRPGCELPFFTKETREDLTDGGTSNLTNFV
jgi:transcriptional regulator NrdR family protein